MTDQQTDDAQPEAARVIIEVVAGVVPQHPIPERTRRYVVTSRQWQEAEDQAALLAELNGRANGYAALLMMQPDQFNWVRVGWNWL